MLQCVMGYALRYAVARMCVYIYACAHLCVCVYVCMNIHAHAHHTCIDEKRQGQSDRQAQEGRCVSRPLVAPAIVTGYVSVSVLWLWQYVAVCCNALQCGVVYCNVVE